MPELPEVETMSRDLRAGVIRKEIKNVWTDWPRIIKNGDQKSFNKSLAGAKVEEVYRRGKYLVFKMKPKKGELYFVFHPKMTGHPHILDAWAPAKHLHLAIIFKDGTSLGFRDIRKFSRAYLFHGEGELEKGLGLGPEPLNKEFTSEAFRAILNKSRKKRIKDLLLDQARIAGIGNIYADESLWRSKINPERKAGSLSAAEAKMLYENIGKILREAIIRRGSSVKTYRTPSGKPGGYASLLKAYGREGLPCPRCGVKIVRKRVGGRSAHFCPNCQRK